MMAQAAEKIQKESQLKLQEDRISLALRPIWDPNRLTSLLTGAFLTIVSYLAMINIHQLENSHRIILSIVCYIGQLILFYNVFQALMSSFGYELERKRSLRDFAQRFVAFFLTLSISSHLMYTLVYIPILRYSTPKDPVLIFFTSLFYSIVAAGIFTRMESKVEKSPILKTKLMSRFFDDERSEKIILFVVACLFGPGIISMLLQNVYWPVSLKIQLSVVAYVSLLYLFFSVYDNLISLIVKSIIGHKPNPSIPIEFAKFYLTFLTSAVCMYTFIYIPVLHYQTPKNFSVIFVTTGLYSFLAAAISYRFRQMKTIALKSKVAQAEAQYSLLESQMQPHFLFNSLNVLSELIYVDPDLANSMAQKMADLYREILNNSKNNFSNLESEISILKKYVEIQKIRFGERIRFNVDVSPAFFNLQIPSLMLQTLVENAIKHGISPKQEGGEINLSVKKVGNMFEVCISNTGALYKGHQESKRSTGLQNTKNRLELTYGSKNSFQIYSDEQRTYVKFLITGRTS